MHNPFTVHSTLSRVFVTLLVISPRRCWAVLVNRTIDSQFGDRITGFVPRYSPESIWNDQTCPEACFIRPDRAFAFDGTWMAATYSPQVSNMNFTLQFTGIAIWVFFILSNNNALGPSVVTNTQANFTLDGEHAGRFSHMPDDSTFSLQYNVTVFSQTGLQNGTHELVVSVIDYPFPTFVNFDWAMYTIDDSDVTSTTSTSTSSTSPTNSAAVATQTPPSRISIIVGCSLGGVSLLVIALVLYHIRKRNSLRSMVPDAFLRMDGPQRELSSRPSQQQTSICTYTGSTQAHIPRQAENGALFHHARFLSTKMYPPASEESGRQRVQNVTTLRNQVQELQQVEQMQDSRQGAPILAVGHPPAYWE